MCSAYLQGLQWLSVQHERQRFRHMGIGMWRDSDLELQFGRRVISTSSSAPTSRFIVLMMRLSIWIGEPSDGAGQT